MSLLQICVSLFFLYHCIEGNVFHRGSDFMAVARTDAFVDKTMFLKAIIERGPRILITAPSKFGKSTNLNMLKTFLSINSFNNQTIMNTFMKLSVGEDDTSFISNYYGQYAVVYVNFKAGIIKSYHDALNFYKRAIHEAFLEHQCCLRLPNDIKFWKDLSGENGFKIIYDKELNSGISGLINMVKKNYNKKMLLLIDDYDSVANNALFNIRDNSEFLGVHQLTLLILNSLMLNKVEKTVITGSTYISSGGLYLKNLKRYYFLCSHPFDNFYGLTEHEVALLYVKDDFIQQSKKQTKAKKFYNGYVSLRGTHIYNTYSFLNFLETGKTALHLETSDYISNVIKLLKYPDVAKIVDSLLTYQSVTTEIKYRIEMRDVIDLRNFYFFGNAIHFQNINILLSHFLELGLLTYDTISKDSPLPYGMYKVKIPNVEIYGIIFNNVMEYFSLKCKLSWVLSANYPTFKTKLHELYNSTIGRCKHIVVSFIDSLKTKKFGDPLASKI